MKKILGVICSLSFLGLSCGGGDKTPVTPVSLESLRLHHIKGVLFEKNFSESGSAEIEVHVIDNDSRRSVLCSGLEHGMQAVQNPGQDYDDLDATLIRTEGLTSDTVGRFRVAVVERDSRHCPDALGEEGMKVLGETSDLSSSDLTAGSLSFKGQKTGYVLLQKRSGDPDPLTVEDLQNTRLKYLFIKYLASGEISRPEIEVHLIDVWNNRGIACIGDDQGLEGIEEEGIEYDNLFLSFVPIANADSEVESQWLRAVVVERDLGRCPQPFDVWNDRIIAATDVLTAEDLLTGTRLDTAQNIASIEFIDIDSFKKSPGF